MSSQHLSQISRLFFFDCLGCEKWIAGHRSFMREPHQRGLNWCELYKIVDLAAAEHFF